MNAVNIRDHQTVLALGGVRAGLAVLREGAPIADGLVLERAEIPAQTSGRETPSEEQYGERD